MIKKYKHKQNQYSLNTNFSHMKVKRNRKQLKPMYKQKEQKLIFFLGNYKKT